METWRQHNSVTQLNQVRIGKPMYLVADTIVVGFGLFLVALAGVIFLKPALAEGFFGLFAGSARAHYTEQVCRLLIGASLTLLAPTLVHPTAFRLIGWAIVISSMVLLLTPWQWHYRFGTVVRPRLIRYLRLFGLGIFAFGVLLLYEVY